MADDDDYDGGDESLWRVLLTVAAVLAAGVLGWVVVRPALADEDPQRVAPPGVTLLTDTAPTTGADSEAGSTTSEVSTAPNTGSTAGATTSAATTIAATTTAAPTTTSAPTTTRAPRTTRAPTTAARPQPVTYETLPDGTPAPLVAIFDVSQITLTGAVPDQAAKDRAQALALANAKPGQGNIVNFLTINPDVPRSIGVRVVELTSARFPAGSAEVLPAHALELDRVVSIMNALPKITALVIGHADQRGDPATNFALSEDRADSVVNYVASHGIAPSRLSSRAVGEADLLTLNNDDAALALNRRTEFVFYGLLIE